MTTSLTFQNTKLSVINQNNQIWLSALDVGKSLGYSQPVVGVTKIYDRHHDEFTEKMTALIDMPTAGGLQKVRIFSLRGAHLIAMFARTKVAKDFRKWVLDVLDREILQNANQIQPLVERKYTFEFTEYELEQLVWLWCGHKQMNTLLGDMIKPLETIGSYFTGMVISHHQEYQRQYKNTLPTIQKLIAPFKASNQMNWERAKNLISQ